MKKFLIVTLIGLILSFSSAYADEEIKIRHKPYSAAEDMDAEKILNQLLETAKFFDEKYPKEKITEDMNDDIRKAFPNLSNQQVYDFQLYIREGLGAYRYIKNLYKEYKDKLLTPKEPPVIVDDDQYAVAPEKEYIDNKDGVVIVTDIKQIVPYSQNRRDIEAAEAKMVRDAYTPSNKKGNFDDLKYISSRIELKKLPFYGIIYPNPLTGNKGLGEWNEKDNILVRLATDETGVRDADEISGIIQFIVKKGHFVIANNGRFHRPQINFEKSENLKNIEINYPIASRILTADNNDWTVYSRKFSLPIKLEVEDKEKPLVLRADITLDACDGNFECISQTISPELTLNAEYKRSSSVSNHIYQQHVNLPKPESDELSIQSFLVKSLPNIGNFLEIKLKSASKISAFNIYIDNDENITFKTPHINIDGKTATVRFFPLDKETSLIDYKFEISVNLNNDILLRQELTARNGGMATQDMPSLSWKIIFAAFIGGLLLNLMPCVFPVLSIKLLSLTKFGARQSSNVRRNFRNTLLGIFCGMFGLASSLAWLKYLDYRIGWGMQFQNPYFIITMIFAVLCFIMSISDVVSFRLPECGQKLLSTSSPDSFSHLITGILVVLMSTPCTAPYLGTAIGFALAGNITDIYCVLGAVALGLSLPYILLYAFPALIAIVPTPGPWMQRLSHFMSFMLFLTMIWLFTILAAQTNTAFTFRLVGYVLICGLFLWLNHVNRENEYEDLPPKAAKRAKLIFSSVLLGISLICYIIALADGGVAYHKQREAITQTHKETIDISEINSAINNGQTVIVAIGADWCLTCKFNNATVFDLPSQEEIIKNKNIKFIKIDWTNYDKEVLMFMEKYKRSGLPFYILFSPLVPDGFVLPEVLNSSDLNQLINNFTIR